MQSALGHLPQSSSTLLTAERVARYLHRLDAVCFVGGGVTGTGRMSPAGALVGDRMCLAARPGDELLERRVLLVTSIQQHIAYCWKTDL